MYECWFIVYLLLSFKQGLKTLGVLEKIQTYPEAFYSIFCHKPENLSAKILSDLFTVRTLTDVQALGFWNSYLQAVEGMWMFYFYLTVIEHLFQYINLFEFCLLVIRLSSPNSTFTKFQNKCCIWLSSKGWGKITE